jgi:hypothetical protein
MHYKSIWNLTVVLFLIIHFFDTYKTQEFIQSCLNMDQLEYGEEAIRSTFFNKNLSLVRVVQSSNYPNTYEKNTNCIFLIYGYIFNYFI